MKRAFDDSKTTYKIENDYRYIYIIEKILKYDTLYITQILNEDQLSNIYNLIKFGIVINLKIIIPIYCEYSYIYYTYIVKNAKLSEKYRLSGCNSKFLIGKQVLYYSRINDHDNAYKYSVKGLTNIICVNYLSYYYMFVKYDIKKQEYYINLGMKINSKKMVTNLIRMLKLSDNKHSNPDSSEKITSLNTLNNILSDNNFVLNSMNDEYKSKIKTLIVANVKHKSEILSIRTEILNMNIANNKYKSEVINARNDVDKYKSEAINARNEINKYKSDVITLNDKYNKYKSKLTSLISDLSLSDVESNVELSNEIITDKSETLLNKSYSYNTLNLKEIRDTCWRIGCNEKSVIGPRGKYQKIYCSSHGRNLKSRYVCKIKSCLRRATCGQSNAIKPNRCYEHSELIVRSLPMIYNRCVRYGCKSLGIYSITGTCNKMSYCKNHKLDNTIKIKLYCNHHNCNNEPSIGYNDEKYPLVCIDHVLDMGNIGK